MFKNNDAFIGNYQELIRTVMIPYQYAVFNDEVEGVDKSLALDNFRIAAGDKKDNFYGMVFQDSDVAKWLEAVAYSLERHPDKKLEAIADEVIDIIARAACEDGYLNTYFTVKEPEHKWQNLHECHELYCAGHMIEAATAYYNATKKDTLLKTMCNMADLIYSKFGDEASKKQRGIPGHPEIELALMKLYKTTGNKNYEELAYYFINERGLEPNFFEEETKRRGWEHFPMNALDREYAQNRLPVREEKDAVGHAVRAVYLYSGMADLALSKNDDSLFKACKRMWDSIVNKRMYITGGIGSSHHGEAFTIDYDLPNDTVYAETCASIGLIFFANRMLKLEQSSKYADVMERALYNTVLAGMKLDGKGFFYVNPLEVNPRYAGKLNDYKHVLPVRPGWFPCACCPPNIARLLTSIDEYIFTVKSNTLYANLFIAGMYNNQELSVNVNTLCDYPYDGNISYDIITQNNIAERSFAVRIPDWSLNTTIEVVSNNIKNSINITSSNTKDGYYYLDISAKGSYKLVLRLDMTPRYVYANTNVIHDSGLVSIMRGPLVYCFEAIDNGTNLHELSIDTDKEIIVNPYDDTLLNGICTLSLYGYRSSQYECLYSFVKPKKEAVSLTAVPYYSWANRGKGDTNEMRVWLSYSK